MVYDFGSVTENTDVGMGESIRSCSSSEAEFEMEDRPALIRGRKHFDTMPVSPRGTPKSACDDNMSKSMRGRPRSTRGDALSISLRDRTRSTSATRRIAGVISKFSEKSRKDSATTEIGLVLLDDDEDEELLSGSSKHITSQRIENGDLSVERSNCERPQILRAPSLSRAVDQSRDNTVNQLPVEILQLPIKSHASQSHRLRTETPPRSPRRFWTLRNNSNTAEIPKIDFQANVPDTPPSPLVEKSPSRHAKVKQNENIGRKVFSMHRVIAKVEMNGAEPFHCPGVLDTVDITTGERSENSSQKPNEEVPVCTHERQPARRNVENSPRSPKRLWTHRTGISAQTIPSMDNLANAPRVPSSPSTVKRFWSQNNDEHVVSTSTHGKKNVISVSPTSPTVEKSTLRFTSPMKAFNQRTFGGILRPTSQQRAPDTHTEPMIGVAEDLNNYATSSSDALLVSPAKRAINSVKWTPFKLSQC
jgi:hypothetical protein